MRVAFPIHYKFLLATTLLLVFSVVSYLALASHIFKRDKIELVYDLNRSRVSDLSSEVGTLFRGINDKLKLAAVLSQDHDSRSKDRLADILNNDGNIVYLSRSPDFVRVDRVLFTDKGFSETYSVNESFYSQKLSAERLIPFKRIQEAGVAVWNASVKGGPPLIGFGRSVQVTEDAHRPRAAAAPYALIAYIRADKLIDTFSGTKLNETRAVDHDGKVLVSGNQEEMWNAVSLFDHPLYKSAIQSEGITGVMTFAEKGEDKLGAHAATIDGQIYLLSQVSSRQVFAAVENLVKRSLIFAMIAVTLAFLVAVLFSRSLTRPLQELTEAMNTVRKNGELGASLIEVKTKDEIAVLAHSFNNMIRDLKVSRGQLQDLNRELEQKVADRTLRLKEQNQAVKVAQEALLQSTRLATVGEVAGRAAHEVLNPLTSLVARLERVRSRLERESVPEASFLGEIIGGWDADLATGGFEKLVANWRETSRVETSQTLWQEDFENVKRSQNLLRTEVANALSDIDFVLKESQRINKIVQNMRSLSRIRSEEKNVAMNPLVGRAVKIMADLGEQHHVRFNEVYNHGDDLVSLDPDEFLQCATNLLRNSIQAILSRNLPVGEGVINITTSQTSESFIIDITDNGIGISPEHKSKLFDVQFSTKPAGEGTGIGLTITRRFIRSFGGEIELVWSEPNRGCQFRITLPLQTPRMNQMTNQVTNQRAAV